MINMKINIFSTYFIQGVAAPFGQRVFSWVVGGCSVGRSVGVQLGGQWAFSWCSVGLVSESS